MREPTGRARAVVPEGEDHLTVKVPPDGTARPRTDIRDTCLNGTTQ